MLNRRAFLALALSGTAGLLAACRSGIVPTSTASPAASPSVTPLGVAATPAPSAAPSPTPSPTPPPPELVAWLDPNLPDALEAAAERLLAALHTSGGFAVRRSEDEGAAALRLSMRPSEQDASGTGTVVARQPFVLVTSPRIPVDGVTEAQARALLAGRVAAWSDVGADSDEPVVPVNLQNDPQPTPGQTTVDSVDDLVTAFEQHPGAVAAVPLASVDYRLQSIAVDGLDPVRAPAEAGKAQFTLDLVAALPADADPAVAAALTSVATTPALVGVPDDAVSVTVCGDIILGRTVHTIMVKQNDFAAPFRLVADDLKAADLTIGNLECSLTDSFDPPSDPYTFSFMTFPKAVAGLELAGIDGVSQANNHSMNFGAQGMRDTLATLDAAGIKHFGIGDNLAAARKPAVFEVRGLRFAFLGYDGITAEDFGAGPNSAGTSPLEEDYLVADIAAAAKQADVVIPFIHWGIEYELTPRVGQREIARRAIEAGATMVVGSHPHWVQGMESYQGRPIVYSLGNFVFDQEWSLETKQGLIMHLVFHGQKLARLQFVPVLIEDYYRPRIVEGQQKTTILNRVWQSTDELAADPVSQG